MHVEFWPGKTSIMLTLLAGLYEVITMVMYAKIRRMFFREHLSINEIARRTTLTRNTVMV